MINLSMADPEHNLRPRLTVMGVGGAGGNAINNMIRCNLEGCDFIGANTDSQALALSLAPRKIQLGINLSRGLGGIVEDLLSLGCQLGGDAARGPRPDFGGVSEQAGGGEVVAEFGPDAGFTLAGSQEGDHRVARVLGSLGGLGDRLRGGGVRRGPGREGHRVGTVKDVLHRPARPVQADLDAALG